KLRIIVNHLPFPEWDGKPEELRAALKPVSVHKNVYIKVSDVVRRVNGKYVEDVEYYRPALDVLFDLFGPDRVVHATNWPVSERVAPYAVVQKIVADYFGSKGRQVEERYFWRNSHAAYRWLARGTAAHLKP
ncbi:MAG TPA: amidohydrolase family protein, partial [Opitutaceae bacterium]|nr:amidohydrolase family protein [Opitutaceae bacterium]